MAKIILELSEQDIQIKLDELLGERIAKLTDGFILDKVESVISTKISRMDLDTIFAKAAKSLIKEEFGDVKTYHSQYAKLLHSEATKLLTAQLKLTGVNTNG